jgi:hypothetical protein
MANAYRQFRQSKLPTHRSRAKSDLQTCCDLLQKMRSVWWSAGAMADLGNAALKKASKPDKSADQEARRTSIAASVNTARKEEDTIPTNGVQNHTTHTLDTVPIPATLPLDAASGTLPMVPILPFPNDLDDASFPPTLDSHISPDWLNFDAAFENFDAVLGSSGADQSMELLRPFNFEDFGSFGFPE